MERPEYGIAIGSDGSILHGSRGTGLDAGSSEPLARILSALSMVMLKKATEEMNELSLESVEKTEPPKKRGRKGGRKGLS